ncbi:type 4a pilus biogenesis protein PilO [Neobacillus sp. D3-1R]|uniref:type 4a pilus biogenesis protein PilO n=1 Tax=Neobacillus sp. D3-1R TaxID=3445778 RepID=UPI003FA159A1
MTLQLNKKEKKMVLFIFIIIPLLFIMLYFNYLQPLMADVDSRQQQLKANEKLYETVQKQKSGLKGSIEENTEFLQQRLPVKPLMDQFILDLEKAEILSNSLIQSMSFGSKGEDETNSTMDQALGLTYQRNDGTEVTEDAAESEISETLPSGIVKIPVNLSIKSPSYFELEKFLDTVENLDRIVMVESINFSSQPEITDLQQEQVPLIYQVTLSLYYLPGLVDLQKELPQIETGEPANKRNPLQQFDLNTEEEGE